MLAHASVGKTLARRTAIVKTLHNVLDGTREGLAAHRECERLILKGMRHDPALGRRSLERVTVGKRPPGEHPFNLRFSF